MLCECVATSSKFHYCRTGVTALYLELNIVRLTQVLRMSVDKTLKALGLRKKTPGDKVREAGANLNARFAKLRGATPESRVEINQCVGCARTTR